MTPGLVTAVTVGAIAMYIALAFALRRRSIRWRGPSLERRTGPAASWLPYFLPVPYVVIGLGIGPEFVVPDALRWTGLALVIAGVAFSSWAALTLGRHFDMEVEVHQGHELVRSGPYALVPHPIYTGLAIHLLGACLATGNVILLLGTLFGGIPAFIARAREEDRLLRASGVAGTTTQP